MFVITLHVEYNNKVFLLVIYVMYSKEKTKFNNALYCNRASTCQLFVLIN